MTEEAKTKIESADTADKEIKDKTPKENQDFSFSNDPVDVTVSKKKRENTKKTFTKKGKKKKGPVKSVSQGSAYIKATYNNTLITLTDQNGNVLAWSSAGMCGFRGPKKSTPYAASVIVKDVVEKVKKHGLQDVNVFVRGVGSGREAAIRALNANGINISSIKDTTPIPHNGCRAKKPRRV